MLIAVVDFEALEKAAAEGFKFSFIYLDSGITPEDS